MTLANEVADESKGLEDEFESKNFGLRIIDHLFHMGQRYSTINKIIDFLDIDERFRELVEDRIERYMSAGILEKRSRECINCIRYEYRMNNGHKV